MSAACSDHLLTLDFLTVMQVGDFQMFYWSNTIRHVKFDSLTFLVSSQLILFSRIPVFFFLFFCHSYLMPPLQICHLYPLFILATSLTLLFTGTMFEGSLCI